MGETVLEVRGKSVDNLWEAIRGYESTIVRLRDERDRLEVEATHLRAALDIAVFIVAKAHRKTNFEGVPEDVDGGDEASVLRYVLARAATHDALQSAGDRDTAPPGDTRTPPPQIHERRS